MSRINSGDEAVQDSVAKDGAFGVDATSVAGGVVVSAANPDRIELFVQNVSDTDVLLGLGEVPDPTPATMGGIYLAANGGFAIITSFLGIVYAKHAGAGNKRLSCAEV